MPGSSRRCWPGGCSPQRCPPSPRRPPIRQLGHRVVTSAERRAELGRGPARRRARPRPAARPVGAQHRPHHGSGQQVRVRLSNRYGASRPGGTHPLTVLAATVARRDDGRGRRARTRSAASPSRGGAMSRSRPARTVVSDPVDAAPAAGQDLAVSLHVQQRTRRACARRLVRHLLRRTAGSGDHTREVSGSSLHPAGHARRCVLTGVDVRGASLARGRRSDRRLGRRRLRLRRRRPHRFPVLAEPPDPPRAARSSAEAVVNNGLGGTTARPPAAPGAGPSVEERLAHDTLALSGITHLLVYAGTNDIGGAAPRRDHRRAALTSPAGAALAASGS